MSHVIDFLVLEYSVFRYDCISSSFESRKFCACTFFEWKNPLVHDRDSNPRFWIATKSIAITLFKGNPFMALYLPPFSLMYFNLYELYLTLSYLR